ncbi:hypothetical protein D3C77_358960 [compost metagenome]
MIGVIQQLQGEIADQIIDVLLIHNAADDLGYIRHADDIPVICLVAFMVDLLLAARQNVPVLGENRAQRVQYFRKHAVNPVVLLIQQLIQILIEFDHLLRTLDIGMEPVFMDFRFNISVFLLLFGDERALRIPQLLVRLILRRLNVARNAQQVLTQRLDIG